MVSLQLTIKGIQKLRFCKRLHDCFPSGNHACAKRMIMRCAHACMLFPFACLWMTMVSRLQKRSLKTKVRAAYNQALCACMLFFSFMYGVKMLLFPSPCLLFLVRRKKTFCFASKTLLSLLLKEDFKSKFMIVDKAQLCATMIYTRLFCKRRDTKRLLKLKSLKV